MIVTFANMGRGVTTLEFQRNFDRVVRRAGLRSVFGWVEIDEADKPEEMDYLVDRLHKTHLIVGDNTNAPLCIPRHLALVDWDVEPACKGLAGMTPNRVITQATIGLPGGLEVGGNVTHVPKYWPETTSRRKEVRQKLRQESKKDANGFWLADTNTRKGWPTIVPGEKTLFDAGIDRGKVWATERRDGKKLKTITSKPSVIPLNIDGHDGHSNRVLWVAA